MLRQLGVEGEGLAHKLCDIIIDFWETVARKAGIGSLLPDGNMRCGLLGVNL